MNNLIPVNEPSLNGNEEKYVLECIKSGWISSEGPFIKKFEQKMSSYFKRKHCITVSSGTAALDISISALGIKKNDEIIVPTFTIISCIQQILRVGAIPVFIDTDLDTWNMSVEDIEKNISNKTKAIMIVHIYGLTVDMNPILNLSKKYNLTLIEDTAEAIGQKYYGKKCGTFGDISTMSFYANKNITTGEGGMILTDNDNLAAQCRSLKNLCFIPKKRFVHYQLGWNYRMTNMQAAIGLAQLEKIESTIIKKINIGNQYIEELKHIDKLQLPLKSTRYSSNIFWVFGIIFKSSLGNINHISEKLFDMGIGNRPFFYPLHLQPVLKNYKYKISDKLTNSEYLYKHGLYLPSSISLSQNDVTNICNIIKRLFKNY